MMRIPPHGPDPNLSCVSFSDADEALLYDAFVRVVQDIAGAAHVPLVPNFQILDCRDRHGARHVFLRSGFGDEVTFEVEEGFAAALEAVIECALSTAPDPWDFGLPPEGFRSGPE